MERPGDHGAEPGATCRAPTSRSSTAPTSRARRRSSPTFLADYTTEWKSEAGADKTVKWPTGTGAKGNAGVAGGVKQTDGAVGYVEQAYALQNNFTYASVKNKSGKLRRADARRRRRRRARASRSRPTSASTIDQLAGAERLPDHLADVHPRLQGHVQGGRPSGDQARRQGVARTTPWATASERRPELQYAPLPASILRQGQGQGRRPAVQRLAAQRLTLGIRPRWKHGAVSTPCSGGRPILGRSPLARLPDRALKWGLTALAALILALIGYFFVRLVIEAQPAFEQVRRLRLHLRQQLGRQRRTSSARCRCVVGTLITSALALLIGVPVAVATALYVTELCPPRLRGR